MVPHRLDGAPRVELAHSDELQSPVNTEETVYTSAISGGLDEDNLIQVNVSVSQTPSSAITNPSGSGGEGGEGRGGEKREVGGEGGHIWRGLRMSVSARCLGKGSHRGRDGGVDFFFGICSFVIYLSPWQQIIFFHSCRNHVPFLPFPSRSDVVVHRFQAI